MFNIKSLGNIFPNRLIWSSFCTFGKYKMDEKSKIFLLFSCMDSRYKDSSQVLTVDQNNNENAHSGSQSQIHANSHANGNNWKSEQRTIQTS